MKVSTVTPCPLLPLGDYVVLQPMPPPPRGALVRLTATPWGRGTVVAVGPDVEGVVGGALVVHRPFAVTRVTVGDAEWVLVREADVVARLSM